MMTAGMMMKVEVDLGLQQADLLVGENDLLLVLVLDSVGGAAAALLLLRRRVATVFLLPPLLLPRSTSAGTHLRPLFVRVVDELALDVLPHDVEVTGGNETGEALILLAFAVRLPPVLVALLDHVQDVAPHERQAQFPAGQVNIFFGIIVE